MVRMIHDKAFINGEWVSAISKKTFAVSNPSTGENISSVPDMSTEDTKLAIQAAHKAFDSWKNTSSRVSYPYKPRKYACK